jgi:hypothetical protein
MALSKDILNMNICMNPKEFHTIGLEYIIKNILKVSMKLGKHSPKSPCLPN